MPVVRRTSNPIEYVPDFSFFGDMAGIASNFVSKYPELKMLDQSVKDNASHKQDLQRGMMGVMEAIKNDSVNRRAYAKKHGIDESMVPEHLANTFQSIAPKETEDAKDYTASVFNFTKEQIGDLPGASEGLFQQYVATMAGGEGVDMAQVRDMTTQQTNRRTLKGLDTGIGDGTIRGKEATMRYLREKLGGNIESINDISRLYSDQFASWEKEDTEKSNTEQNDLVESNLETLINEKGGWSNFITDEFFSSPDGLIKLREKLLTGTDVNNPVGANKAKQVIDDLLVVMNKQQKDKELEEATKRARLGAGQIQKDKVVDNFNQMAKSASNNANRLNAMADKQDKLNTKESKNQARILRREANRQDALAATYAQQAEEQQNEFASGKTSLGGTNLGLAKEASDKADFETLVEDLGSGEFGKNVADVSEAGFLGFGHLGLGDSDKIAKNLTKAISSDYKRNDITVEAEGDTFTIKIGGREYGSFNRKDIKQGGKVIENIAYTYGADVGTSSSGTSGRRPQSNPAPMLPSGQFDKNSMEEGVVYTHKGRRVKKVNGVLKEAITKQE